MTTWRVSVLGRVGAVGAVCAWIVGASLVTDHRRYGVAVFMWVVAVVAAYAGWAWAFRPFLSMTDSGLTVQNPLDRVELGWADVQSVSPGYFGITIRTNGNR
jgi:hypothetical protein